MPLTVDGIVATGNVSNVTAVTAGAIPEISSAAGIASFPSAASPANGVSLAEVLRRLFDRTIGDGTDASATGRFGIRVTKATADTIHTAAVPLFSVATGRVILLGILGEVTTIIQAQATTAKLQFNPATGTTNDMCATLDINADEVGSLYGITGVPADALLRSESGAVRCMLKEPIALDIGDIEMICGAASSGSIQWTAWYMPLDDGATLAAA